MPFDIQAARNSGYSEADIASYLASKNPSFDAAGARKAGYSDADMITALASRDAAPTFEEKYAQDAKDKNQASGSWDNFTKSIGIGAAKRVMGAGELGLNIAKALGANVDDWKEQLAEGQKEAEIQGTGTGKAGLAGEILGDPTTYMLPGAAAGGKMTVKALAGAGAKLGAVAGVTQGTADKDSNLLDNAKHSAIGTGIGIATAPLVAGASKVIGAGTNMLTSAGNRVMAALGSDGAADRIVYKEMANRLLASGKTPAEVQAAIQEAQASGLSPTVGEATGARGQIQAEQRLARGTGDGAQQFNDRVVERGQQDIPAQLENRGRELVAGKAEANQLYKQAAQEADQLQANGAAAIAQPSGPAAQNLTKASMQALNKPWDALQNARNSITSRLTELGSVSNIESKALAQAKSILDNADRRGASFDAILDAKKQLGDMFIEGADASGQKQANRYVTDFTKQLDDSLGSIAPKTYQDAVSAWKKGLAGQDLLKSVNESGAGDVNAMYNSLWKTPEQRADFLGKLPDDATRGEFQQFFNTLEKVRNGFGGDAAGIAGGAIEGGGALPLTKTSAIRNVIDKAGEMLTPSNMGRRAADAAFNPDAERLANAMSKAGRRVGDKPSVKALETVITTSPSRGTNQDSATPSENQAPMIEHAPQLDVSSGAKPRAEIPADDIIGSAAVSAGNDPDTMRRIAMLESKGNPNAQNPGSSAGGLFQFTDGTWREMVGKYGKETGIKLADKMNPQANATMGNLYARDNAKQLKDAIGRDPNGTEIYLAHFLGVNGAKKLLAHLDKPVSAAQIFPSAAQSNSGVFFMNGDPKQPLTPAGIYRTLTQKLNEAG